MRNRAPAALKDCIVPPFSMSDVSGQTRRPDLQRLEPSSRCTTGAQIILPMLHAGALTHRGYLAALNKENVTAVWDSLSSATAEQVITSKGEPSDT